MDCLVSRCLTAVVVSLACAGSAFGQAQLQPPVTIQVKELESVLATGGDRNTWILRIEARVFVRNDTKEPLRISHEQFQLVADGHPVLPGARESSRLLEPVIVQPSQSVEGWLGYNTMEFRGDEPVLILKWSPDFSSVPAAEDGAKPDEPVGQPAAVEINLNREIRKLNGIRTKAIGPEGCLMQIFVDRNLDVLAAWPLIEEFRKIAAADIQRILFVPGSGAGARPVVMDEFVTWLSAMMESRPGEPVAATPLPATGLRFRHISLAGFTLAANRRFNGGRRTVQLHQSSDDAICSALTSLYRFVPVEQAIADLRNPNAGIRRAAMAGSVDRLTSEQAGAIIEQARTGSAELQLEVASYLNLIPGKGAVDALKQLCLSGNPALSAVALRSLAGSYDNSATDAMAEVWRAAEESPSLQSEAIGAIVASPDDRWIPLVADYVSRFLDQATQPGEMTIRSERIAGALDFLRIRNHSSTRSHVLKEILNVRNPVTQDMFLDYLMHQEQPESDVIIRECVTQRLKTGPLTNSILGAAIRYRDSSWTEALLAEFPQTADSDRSGPRSLHAVLACASAGQLESLIDRAETMSVHQRAELVQHLAQVSHPQWRDLASAMIGKPGERCSEVIQLLAHDASEQSLQLLRDRLESYVAGLEGTPDASVEGQHYLQTLMVHISMFVHPECRRVMNRLARDPNVYVSEHAARLNADAFRRSPAFRSMVEESQLRRAGRVDEANELLERCLELDPLLPDNFVRRASVKMHARQFADSMKDLMTADRLSPEDIEVQSMIALVLVRLDDIEKGLQFAEKVISDAPRDWTSLYNGACSFSRAAESSLPTPEMKQAYADRAIQLLRQTAGLKFDDSEHMLQDEDLIALHDHPEWQAVVELVKSNKEVPPGGAVPPPRPAQPGGAVPPAQARPAPPDNVQPPNDNGEAEKK